MSEDLPGSWHRLPGLSGQHPLWYNSGEQIPLISRREVNLVRKAFSWLLRALCCAVMLALLFSFPFAACAEETDVLAEVLPILVNRDFPVTEDFVPADLVLLTDVLDPSVVRIKNKETVVCKKGFCINH